MDAEKAAEELKIIRRLMERPIRCSVQSGLSGLIAGVAGLAATLADDAISAACQDDTHLAAALCLTIWAATFVVTFVSVLLVAFVRERGRGMPFWTNVKVRILRTILPPFAVAVGLTTAIVWRWFHDIPANQWGMIWPIWMACYGLACWQVGEFSIAETRWMGVAFIATSIVHAFFLQANPDVYWSLGISFGGFHIIYGLVVWVRHGG